jgi:hypothetical protein
MDKNAEFVLNYLEKDMAPTSVGFSFTVHITARFDDNIDVKYPEQRKIQNEFLQFIKESNRINMSNKQNAESLALSVEKIANAKLVGFDFTSFCNFPEENK